MARREFPSRLALKSRARSDNDGPLAKVCFTCDLEDSLASWPTCVGPRQREDKQTARIGRVVGTKDVPVKVK
jgi:hypothetical protein